MVKLNEILSDKDFTALDDSGKREVLSRYYDKVISADPDYAALPEDAQLQVKNKFDDSVYGSTGFRLFEAPEEVAEEQATEEPKIPKWLGAEQIGLDALYPGVKPEQVIEDYKEGLKKTEAEEAEVDRAVKFYKDVLKTGSPLLSIMKQSPDVDEKIIERLEAQNINNADYVKLVPAMKLRESAERGGLGGFLAQAKASWQAGLAPLGAAAVRQQSGVMKELFRDPKSQEAKIIAGTLDAKTEKDIKDIWNVANILTITKPEDEKGMIGLVKEKKIGKALDLGIRQTLQSAPTSLSAMALFFASGGASALATPLTKLAASVPVAASVYLTSKESELESLKNEHPELSEETRNTVASMHSAIEALSESAGTLLGFTGVNKIINRYPRKAAEKILANEALNKFYSKFGKYGAAYLFGTFEEGLEGSFSQLGSNVYDIKTGLKKEGNVLDGVPEAFVSESFAATLMQSPVYVVNAVLNARQKYVNNIIKETESLGNIPEKLANLKPDLESNPDIPSDKYFGKTPVEVEEVLENAKQTNKVTEEISDDPSDPNNYIDQESFDETSSMISESIANEDYGAAEMLLDELSRRVGLVDWQKVSRPVSNNVLSTINELRKTLNENKPIRIKETDGVWREVTEEDAIKESEERRKRQQYDNEITFRLSEIEKEIKDNPRKASDDLNKIIEERDAIIENSSKDYGVYFEYKIIDLHEQLEPYMKKETKAATETAKEEAKPVEEKVAEPVVEEEVEAKEPKPTEEKVTEPAAKETEVVEPVTEEPTKEAIKETTEEVKDAEEAREKVEEKGEVPIEEQEVKEKEKRDEERGREPVRVRDDEKVRVETKEEKEAITAPVDTDLGGGQRHTEVVDGKRVAGDLVKDTELEQKTSDVGDYTKLERKPLGSNVFGIRPQNQFKLYQGSRYYPVHVLLNDVDAAKFKRGKKVDVGYRDEILKIAKQERTNNNEVVLDFRSTEDKQTTKIMPQREVTKANRIASKVKAETAAKSKGLSAGQKEMANRVNAVSKYIAGLKANNISPTRELFSKSINKISNNTISLTEAGEFYDSAFGEEAIADATRNINRKKGKASALLREIGIESRKDRASYEEFLDKAIGVKSLKEASPEQLNTLIRVVEVQRLNKEIEVNEANGNSVQPVDQTTKKKKTFRQAIVASIKNSIKIRRATLDKIASKDKYVSGFAKKKYSKNISTMIPLEEAIGNTGPEPLYLMQKITGIVAEASSKRRSFQVGRHKDILKACRDYAKKNKVKNPIKVRYDYKNRKFTQKIIDYYQELNNATTKKAKAEVRSKADPFVRIVGDIVSSYNQKLSNHWVRAQRIFLWTYTGDGGYIGFTNPKIKPEIEEAQDKLFELVEDNPDNFDKAIDDFAEYCKKFDWGVREDYFPTEHELDDADIATQMIRQKESRIAGGQFHSGTGDPNVDGFWNIIDNTQYKSVSNMKIVPRFSELLSYYDKKNQKKLVPLSRTLFGGGSPNAFLNFTNTLFSIGYTSFLTSNYGRVAIVRNLTQDIARGYYLPKATIARNVLSNKIDKAKNIHSLEKIESEFREKFGEDEKAISAIIGDKEAFSDAMLLSGGPIGNFGLLSKMMDTARDVASLYALSDRLNRLNIVRALVPTKRIIDAFQPGDSIEKVFRQLKLGQSQDAVKANLAYLLETNKNEFFIQYLRQKVLDVNHDYARQSRALVMQHEGTRAFAGLMNYTNSSIAKEIRQLKILLELRNKPLWERIQAAEAAALQTYELWSNSAINFVIKAAMKTGLISVGDFDDDLKEKITEAKLREWSKIIDYFVPTELANRIVNHVTGIDYGSYGIRELAYGEPAAIGVVEKLTELTNLVLDIAAGDNDIDDGIDFIEKNYLSQLPYINAISHAMSEVYGVTSYSYYNDAIKPLVKGGTLPSPEKLAELTAKLDKIEGSARSRFYAKKKNRNTPIEIAKRISFSTDKSVARTKAKAQEDAIFAQLCRDISSSLFNAGEYELAEKWNKKGKKAQANADKSALSVPVRASRVDEGYRVSNSFLRKHSPEYKEYQKAQKGKVYKEL